ncbi:HipA family kinase [Sedimentitalea sp.]|uniref:HipA family kinase n=1 Tax=Sedimentitalea sp. TaxID=2048915 RepID=UPI003298EE8D
MFEARTILRRAGRGRSRPPLCFAENDGGDQCRIWLKSPDFHPSTPSTSLEREWMATNLAQTLGLPVVPVVPVKLGTEFIDSVLDEELREAMLDSPEFVLGSVHAGDGWRLFDTGSRLPWSSLPLVQEIVAFDCLVENSDRSQSNPNLLRHGDKLAMIDQEEAFSHAVTGEGSGPWGVNGLLNFAAGTAQHSLIPYLVPKTRCDFSPVADKWESLPDAAISDYVAQAPDDWDRPTLDRIRDYIMIAKREARRFCEMATRHVTQ